MAARQMSGKRLSNGTSFPNRKVVPVTSDVGIHSFETEYQKTIAPRNYKEEKLAAGIRASDEHNYVEAIKQFSLVKPETVTSLYFSGCARLQLKHNLQTEEAIVDFTKCIELASRTEQPSFGLEVWYKRALAYHNVNKYDEAISDYTEFIHQCKSLGEQEKRELPRGLTGRGLTFQAMYELDMAMKDIDRANKLTNNRDPYYLCCRASVHASKHEYEKAAEDITAASNLNYDLDVEALYQRAIVLAEIGRHNEALEDLKKALELSTKHTQQSDILYRCGVSEYALNNKEQAYQKFGQAINLHPYNVQANYRLGMMQAEKGHYKDALKKLNQAHELAPHQGDILLERANVHQQLGKQNEAALDRKHANQLNSSPFAITTMLADRIKKLRDDIDHTGVTPHKHLELAMAYDGLMNQKKDIRVKLEYYQIAVVEYRTAIQTDTKCLYPQATALFALCQKKMNDLIEAHELHLEFYNILAKHKGAVHHWKAYLLDIKDKMELGKLEPHLDEPAVSKLIQMEFNRRKKDIDEQTYQTDMQDRYKNQLTFYEHMRVDLSNVLAAIGVLNLDGSSIINITENNKTKVGKIVELLSEGETSVPAIESELNSHDKVSTKVLRKTDYNHIKMKLRSIGNVGDMTDQLDVAQLVARHLCTRYHSQFLCLKPKHDNSDDDDEFIDDESSSAWWKCCASRKSSTNPKNPKYLDESGIITKLSTFATAFIIQAINNETIRVSSKTQSARKDALSTALVLAVCQAHPNADTRVLAALRHGDESIPISLTAVSRMLNKSHLLDAEKVVVPVEWTLYSFFQSPGIYYYSDIENGKIRHYGSGPSMIPDVYGYRLGTREEVNVFKKLKRTEE